MTAAIIPGVMEETKNPNAVFVTIDDQGVARFLLDGKRVTLDVLDDALGRPLHVEISDPVWRRIEASHHAVTRIAGGTTPAYGVNTGFGHLCEKRISPDQLEALQTNLIVSHAVGVGEAVPRAIVRWIMLFKLHALTHGFSGISRGSMECLQRMLEADALPVIPTQGSLGASGDLAPLAHMVLAMMGRGTIVVDGREEQAADALARLGIDTVTLGPKEGLALINGTQFMTAYGAVIAVRARRLLKHADVIACMSLEGMRGSVRPFDERLQELRPHAGALDTAENVRRMMSASEIIQSHADCERVQDPYSLRCVAQVHGASRDAIEHAASTIQTEIDAVTDNPLILEHDEVISGGLFHGQPLALVLDYLAIALAELASISERRIYLLLSGVDGLPKLLMKDTGLNSGFMLAQYTAAALVSENKGLCTPASVDSIPTSLGQEDHVSMGARAAVKCLQVLDNTETVLAVEQMCAAQAIDYRAPLAPGVGPRAAHAEVRKSIAHAEKDRLFGEDIKKSLELLRSQRVVRAVEAVVGSMK
ncbi:MAG: histidine ammonia-lyase [Phycisphaerales bacterium]|nr:MAG: histidine ammonia-lyase [Phycisphaerales bacterium]